MMTSPQFDLRSTFFREHFSAQCSINKKESCRSSGGREIGKNRRESNSRQKIVSIRC
jgi:hypothetical protein